MIKCECRKESWQYDFACDYCEDQIEKDKINGEQMNEEIKLYNIYWHDGTERIYVVTTNNVNKWLEENNKQRIADKEKPECLHDFDIEETEFLIY